jgi:hypothetical protein
LVFLRIAARVRGPTFQIDEGPPCLTRPATMTFEDDPVERLDCPGDDGPMYAQKCLRPVPRGNGWR